MDNFLKEIKNQLKFYADRAFFLPLDGSYLKKLEKKIGVNIP